MSAQGIHESIRIRIDNMAFVSFTSVKIGFLSLIDYLKLNICKQLRRKLKNKCQLSPFGFVQDKL